MAYVAPAEFVSKMVDAGESKLVMSTRDTLIRAYMAGAILALAAAFAVTVTVNTGNPLIGALLFPVGFCLLYLMGFDLLTGVFTLAPLAVLDKRPGATWSGVLRNWGLVFCGNFAGAFTVAVFMAIIFTFGFSEAPDAVGKKLGLIGESRTLGYAAHGAAGMLTLFIRGVLCNWMVSTGVVAAMMSTSVSGKVIGMWMPILVFFYMGFEHSIVNMFLFPSGLMLGGHFTLMDYLVWNEIPTILGNLIGGLTFVGATLYATHYKTAPKRDLRGGDAPAVKRAVALTLAVRIGQHSQAGVGKANQDFHGAVLPHGSQLATKGIAIALADGIGSSRVSHVASAAAVRSFLDDYYATSEAWPVRRAAQCVLQATNAWLHAQTQRGDGRFDRDLGCVCTFSALVLKGRDAHLLHVGDSRIYRLHANALEQLTEDHRVGAEDGGSWLGRALGIDRSIEIDYFAWPLEAGETFLLATDGAYEHLDAAAVHAALAANADDFDAAAAALVGTARARGSVDDATLQIVRVDALPEPAAHALQRAREGLALPPPLEPGMHFEGFTIVRPLHVSARSHVHLALDDASGVAVALKTPAVDLADQAAALDRFMLEEWVARRVDSPYVVKAAAVERARRHLFVATEYVEGQTLRQWMIDHPAPSLDSVRSLVEQAARGLQALHRKEMVHLDVRPANLMIDAAGTVRVLDFGATRVAGLLEGGGDEGVARTPAGELQYASPESLLGADVDPRADLFSLAVVTYQMLTGALPYGLELARVRSVADLRRLRYIPLRERRPDLPPWLDAVLRKALQPRPDKRQQAFSEFLHDLRFPGPEFLSPRRLPLIERSPVAFWRGVALLLAAALVMCVMVAGFAASR